MITAAVAVAGLFLCQDPAPNPQVDRGQQSRSSNNSGGRRRATLPDREARARVKAFEKALKPKKVPMKLRRQALDLFEGGISRQLIKPLARFIEEDPSVMLRRRAVEILAYQPRDRAKPAILKLLKKARVTANPQVHAGLIRALSSAGYDAKDWRVIKDMFEDDYDTERIPLHEAILDLIAQHKEKQALPLLLRNLDEPAPKDVHGADNPPAEYWKARWHSWAAWRGKVKQALFAITGQNFGSAAEAKAWLKKNRTY